MHKRTYASLNKSEQAIGSGSVAAFSCEVFLHDPFYVTHFSKRGLQHTENKSSFLPCCLQLVCFRIDLYRFERACVSMTHHQLTSIGSIGHLDRSARSARSATIERQHGSARPAWRLPRDDHQQQSPPPRELKPKEGAPSRRSSRRSSFSHSFPCHVSRHHPCLCASEANFTHSFASRLACQHACRSRGAALYLKRTGAD